MHVSRPSFHPIIRHPMITVSERKAVSRLHARTHHALQLLVAITLLAASFANAESKPRPNPVGLTLVTYEDPVRRDWTGTKDRPLATAVWYPAAAGTRETKWRIGFFNAGMNAIGAPMAASPAKLPLIVLSHGTGGGAAAMAWLAEILAANGYLVAVVNHHGNTAAEPAYRLEGFIVWWDRPMDISVLIDKLLADPRFGPRIDTTRIGVAGFSLGGYTALATVGARLNRAQWQSFCAAKPTDPNCNLPPEAKSTMDNARRLIDENERLRQAFAHSDESFRDVRVKAALAIAPVLGPALTASSLAEVGVPVRIVVGSQDDQGVPDINAKVIAAAIPKAELEILPGVAHYTFLAPCNIIGRFVARQLCVDPDGIDRETIHTKVGTDALGFFNAALKVEGAGSRLRQ